MSRIMDQANPYSASARREIRAGLRDIAPVMAAAIPIGLPFGAIAAAKGLSPAEVALMSALVFAGGAPLASIETRARSEEQTSEPHSRPYIVRPLLLEQQQTTSAERRQS